METTPAPKSWLDYTVCPGPAAECGECPDCGALLDDEHHRPGCPAVDPRGTSKRRPEWG